MAMRMKPSQAQAYQARRWANALSVRMAQVLGDPKAGRSSMVKPVPKYPKPKAPGSKAP